MKEPILKLRQADGNLRPFYLPGFISGLVARNASELADKLKEDNVPFELIEQGAQFVSDVYENKFSSDEFLTGTHSQYLAVVIFAVCQSVLGKVAEAANLLESVYTVQNKKKNPRPRNKRKNKPHTQKP
ncbi:phage tail assembly chaperone G [Bacillus wiedmannii]